ncbi:MAG: peptidoglycan DD-metalloendopeptidase family protein [Spirochaetia bacterium]|jgi:murein DD-endopeptidase MepM/ murein hydrolase activator NlpD|nr:peptidoglycan DD-metalloendopeptidase family protein [Spirochaetia bacterium]
MNTPDSGQPEPGITSRYLSIIKNYLLRVCTDKTGRWKLYTLIFSITIFIFSIMTTQVVESRQNSKNSKADTVNHFFTEVNRYEKDVVIKSGETLASILYDLGINKIDASDIIESVSSLYNLKYLQPGKKIRFVIFENGEENLPVVELLKMEKTAGTEIRVCARDGKYEAKLVTVKTIKVHTAAEGVITNSLYSDAALTGIPDSAIMEMFQLFSFDIDFQRDIYRGDKFRVLFENIINMDGEVVSKGNIIFAQLQMSNKDHKVYRFVCDDGKTDYFNESGVNIRKTLLKTPIYGARISSGYGRREHPIYGYSQFHQALDFAAPRDTPIIASGSGVVKLADWNGSYGKCVIIQHSNQYQTLYAHMNSFANNIRRGKSVRQGEIIGYVGTTGVSTGNHLHYEVIFRGKRLNPSTIKTPPEKKLTEDELIRFLKEVETIDMEFTNSLTS